MRHRIPRICRRLVVAMLALQLTALAWAGAPRSLHFQHIGLDEGLPQESVLAILQDRTGFMWFGTQAGLARFDGYRHRVFRNDPGDAASLPDNYVQAAYEDGKGRLWFGTRGGLVRFDAGRQGFVRQALSGATEQNVEPGARNSAVTAIIGDGKDGLWVATVDGLAHLDGAGSARIHRHDGHAAGSLGDDRVTALALDARGGLWVGTGVGLDYLAPGATRFAHHDIAGPVRGDPRYNSITALSMGARDTLWIGTAAGLEAWHVGQGEGRAPTGRHRVGADEGIGEVRVNQLYRDRDANLWVCTDQEGLKWRGPAGGRFVGYVNRPLDRHTLSDNQVRSVWVDRTGTLWVGTISNGIDRADLASGGFGRFDLAAGHLGEPGSRKIRAIAAGADGRLWMGTTGAGLMHLDPASGRVERIRHDPARRASLPDDTVGALLLARGKLWVGSPGGLAWRDASGGGFTRVALGSEAGASHVQYLMQDRAGALWVATRGGLFMLDADGRVRQAWRHDPADPRSLGENYGYALLEDRSGAIWIGTENGLDRLDHASGTFTHFRHDPRDAGSLRHNRVYTLFESRRGELWVGTAGGLHRIEHAPGGVPRFRLFPVAEAREQLPIGAVLEDARGLLWVSSTAGLSRLDPASGRFKLYNARDGLIDGAYFVGSAARSADGELHFGGMNGMTSFRPEAIRDNPFAPAVAITDFLVFNQPRPLQGVVALDYREAVFTLEFAALHYADPDANRYAYRLRGFDRDWTETGAGKRFATYTNLDPGAYVFEVRAANKDGVWSPHPAGIAITIAPPFWLAWWFRLGAGILVLGSALALYRLRIRVLLQRTARLEHQVGLRTAELVLQKESAERRKQEAETQKEAVERAYRQLEETQAQLAAHEKLASLGALVAGVAHELNTPIGNSLLMASTLQEKTETLSARFTRNELKKSELEGWIGAAREASALIVRSLHAAADLVNSFKQVSVDRASTRRRRFDLGKVCHEILATMMNGVRRAGHTLVLQVEPGIGMDSYPGPLGQVLINFVNNALLHAFDGRGGTMTLSAARIDGERVRIVFRDDGRGIPPEHLARIFDPFFTTRMGQGGTGLGLHIAYTIVTTLLGGTIRVESVEGEGTVFTLDLPLRAVEVAPAPAPATMSS
jgi:ligand-binding sensor domain-containing protein/signal transduction histidine kinase